MRMQLHLSRPVEAGGCCCLTLCGLGESVKKLGAGRRVSQSLLNSLPVEQMLNIDPKLAWPTVAVVDH
jgi:hypothetical protein